MSNQSTDPRQPYTSHHVRRGSRIFEEIEDGINGITKGIKRRLSSPVRHQKILRRLTREHRRSSSKESSGDESGSAEEFREIPRSSARKLEPQQGLRRVRDSWRKSNTDFDDLWNVTDHVYDEPGEMDGVGESSSAMESTMSKLQGQQWSSENVVLKDMVLRSSPPPDAVYVEGPTMEIDREMERTNAISKPHNQVRPLRLQTKLSNLEEKIQGPTGQTASPSDSYEGGSATSGKHPVSATKASGRTGKGCSKRSRVKNSRKTDGGSPGGSDDEDSDEEGCQRPRSKGKGNKYPCPWKDCDQCHSTWELARIKERIRRVHLRPWKCPHCEYCQGDTHQIMRHQRTQHNTGDPVHSTTDQLALEKHNRLNKRNLGYEAIRDICNAETLEALSPTIVKKEEPSDDVSSMNINYEGEADPDCPCETDSECRPRSLTPLPIASEQPDALSMDFRATSTAQPAQPAQSFPSEEATTEEIQRLLQSIHISRRKQVLARLYQVTAMEEAEADCRQNQVDEQPWDSVGAQSDYPPYVMSQGLGVPGPSSLPGLTNGHTATVTVRPSQSSLQSAIGVLEQPQGMQLQNTIIDASPMLPDYMELEDPDQVMATSLVYYPEDQAKQMLPPPPPAQFTRQFSDEWAIIQQSRQS